MSHRGFLFLGVVGTSSLMLTVTSAPSFWHPSNHLQDSANLHSSNALQDSSNLVYGPAELGDPFMSEHYPNTIGANDFMDPSTYHFLNNNHGLQDWQAEAAMGWNSGHYYDDEHVFPLTTSTDQRWHHPPHLESYLNQPIQDGLETPEVRGTGLIDHEPPYLGNLYNNIPGAVQLKETYTLPTADIQTKGDMGQMHPYDMMHTSQPLLWSMTEIEPPLKIGSFTGESFTPSTWDHSLQSRGSEQSDPQHQTKRQKTSHIQHSQTGDTYMPNQNIQPLGTDEIPSPSNQQWNDNQKPSKLKPSSDGNINMLKAIPHYVFQQNKTKTSDSSKFQSIVEWPATSQKIGLTPATITDRQEEAKKNKELQDLKQPLMNIKELLSKLGFTRYKEMDAKQYIISFSQKFEQLLQFDMDSKSGLLANPTLDGDQMKYSLHYPSTLMTNNHEKEDIYKYLIRSFENLIRRCDYLLKLSLKELETCGIKIPSKASFFEWLEAEVFDRTLDGQTILTQPSPKDKKLSIIKRWLKYYIYLPDADQKKWKEPIYLVGLWYKNFHPQIWTAIGNHDQFFWDYMRLRIKTSEEPQKPRRN
ncbi:hypothetical protein PGT21_026466 [Puccinia graminis f. sp. tritici]|uniref:Uncharacterized protein n=1 Tax=Puccinia graminis f. sp. tritici TaxID=56615 RepID=A0A5B0MXE9_PUCGR|nr:hypothetical protein PGT21_026466 [Puccinia graminis f. sp. tritici]KAA1131123.1 hypothetical protein PGTUg99_011531 [Puccinia graminis f. sp. tritici]